MSEAPNPASQIRDFLSGIASNPQVAGLKDVVTKLTSLPGVSQFKAIQIQMLRVQEELLKGQIMIIQQLIQAMESAPDTPAAAPAQEGDGSGTNGKIIIT